MKPKEAKQAVNRATTILARVGTLVEVQETGESGQQPKVMRLPGREPVVLRQRGSRDIDEIPISEIAALLASGDDPYQAFDLPVDDKRVEERLEMARGRGS